MEASDFHMFLSSNTNPIEFPDNKASDFTTLYGESVKLDGNWEVGVKQVTYPKRILTTTGGETLSTTLNVATDIEGWKAVIKDSQLFYDFDVYEVQKPPWNEKTGRKGEDIVKNFNKLPLAQNALELEYNASDHRFVLHVKVDGYAFGLSASFGWKVLQMHEQIYARGSHWGYYYNEKSKFDGFDWKVWVFPLFRLEKKVITICEKDDDMTSDAMIQRVISSTADYPVKWHVFRGPLGKKLNVQTKPDPLKDVECAILWCNDACKDMLEEPTGYFESQYDNSLYLDSWIKKRSYKDSKYFRKEAVQIIVYSRKICNRSPFFRKGSWYTLTFPRKSYNSPEELLTTLKSLKPPKWASIDFSYNAGTKRFNLLIPFKTGLRMDPIICDILGFKHREYFAVKDFTADYTPALDRGIENFFVYSSITEDIFVGNVKAPLLCIVPRNKEASPSGSSWSVYSPTYVPLGRVSFNQQRILIMDQAGDRVPFDDGTSVVLLHFRKRL